ncbi:MAG: dienelactone hydrolase family protein [Streptosporangiaceae bacterium]
MRIISSRALNHGVTETLFSHDDIPGVLWRPAGAAGPRPLVLVGHGGGQHKKAPGAVGPALRFVTWCGFAAAAIDAPNHGDRVPGPEHQALVAEIRAKAEAGEPIGPHMGRYNAALATQAVPDWQAVLDALQKLELPGSDPAGGSADRAGTGPVAGGPVGYYGVSMGAGLGIPLVAAEPRITAAVFGLAASAPLMELAGRITVPVQFLVQRDDEMVPCDSALALFDAFGAREKTLHANPGGHGELPRFEADSAALFFGRHLTPA